MTTTARVPLWRKSNNSVYSSPFCVQPRGVVVLTAVGFDGYATQDSGSFKTALEACIQRIVYDFEPRPDCVCRDGFEWVWDVGKWVAREVASVDIATGSGCCWSLSDNHNVGVIGLPGTYRLVLNDQDAVGTAQVWAEQYAYVDLPPQIANLFFQ